MEQIYGSRTETKAKDRLRGVMGCCVLGLKCAIILITLPLLLYNSTSSFYSCFLGLNKGCCIPRWGKKEGREEKGGR